MVSIIIVNYHVKKELFACIESIIASNPKTAYAVIVVDNDEEKTIYTDLHKRFPRIKYIPNDNKGFGQGNNVGARYAKGKYLFFLNPDTEVNAGCIDTLVDYLNNHPKAGIAAPFLYDREDKPFPQGAKTLTPFRAIFSFSFINTLFPDNPIAKNYWMKDKWNKKSPHEVGSVPGTAFMIRREIFEKIEGFDEHFFLYFEEHDLCKRIRESGWKMVMLPQAKVYHALGRSTRQRKDTKKIFTQSRFYYFRKHFGLMEALLTESILRINKYTVLLAIILTIGIFLRFDRISELMVFIGDQGWFYLSARDMLLTGEIPLVGIASSRPWLHQGPLWTYMLAPVLWLSHFNPVSGAYLSGMLGVSGVLGMYKLGSLLFSARMGLMAAALFATSPLVITFDRMAYHTSPIPLFTILFIYFLYKWVSGNIYFFPLIIATLAILYNFELATALLGIVTIAMWLYGFMAKKYWARKIFSFKFLVLSFFAFVVPMLPMLLYDVGHGFPQTLGFMAWLGYRFLVLLGYPPINPATSVSIRDLISFFAEQYIRLVFPYSGLVALCILGGSLVYSFLSFRVTRPHPSSLLSGEGILSGMTLLLVLNVLLIAGFFAAKTPSGAYLPMLFPGLILLAAIVFDRIVSRSFLRIPGIVFLSLMIFLNVHFLLSNNYFFGNQSNYLTFAKRLSAVRNIITESNGREYNLNGRGPGSEFESFTMNYEYLLWWLGHGPSQNAQLIVEISENPNEIKVIEK